MILALPIDRQLARLLAMAIVMIAAVLAPSAVWAHQGHVHAGGHGHHASVRPAVPAVAAPSDLSRVDAVASAAVIQAAAEPAAERPSAPCSGLCCGVACCVSAILPTATIVPLPVPGRRLAQPASPLARPGDGPDTLREPPRPVLA